MSNGAKGGAVSGAPHAMTPASSTALSWTCTEANVDATKHVASGLKESKTKARLVNRTHGRGLDAARIAQENVSGAALVTT